MGLPAFTFRDLLDPTGERRVWARYDRCCHGGRSSLPPDDHVSRLVDHLTADSAIMRDVPFKAVDGPAVSYARSRP